MKNAEKIALLNTLSVVESKTGVNSYVLVQFDEQTKEVLDKLGKHEDWIQLHTVDDSLVDILPLAIEECGALSFRNGQFVIDSLRGAIDELRDLLLEYYSQEALRGEHPPTLMNELAAASERVYRLVRQDENGEQ
ncbi:hypothetical protein [Bacillus sp. FSL K6-6540]|uniref:hypothetical protein n=1 Tax=Bacillus sp. FSL K6-6540 TaxID=2921512 RepID=UPI0030F747EF